MYAVVRTGGKQYRLGVGDSVKVEKLANEVGNIVELSQVLMISGGGEVAPDPSGSYRRLI